MASTNPDVKLSEEDLERKKKKEEKTQKPQTLSHLSASVFFYSIDFNLTAPGEETTIHLATTTMASTNPYVKLLEEDLERKKKKEENFVRAKKTQIGLSSSRVGEETTVNLAATTMASTNPGVKLSEEDLERKKKKEEKAKEKELKRLKAQQGAASSKTSKKNTLRAYASEENPQDFIDPEGDKKKLSQQMAKQFPPPVAVEKSLVFIS
ncbi:hypothetical protein L2E82_38593 [Cichorium intybus]|uniref:Uncharacterized protein n=1 Tax=Cichorium intybus TaxID=13427 RepID=A0ACB9AHX2_CICIN|nr:hypothetical protein L2E82_38593 [Cichorium intybus]